MRRRSRSPPEARLPTPPSPPPEVPTPNVPRCQFWAQNKCKYGYQCRFLHVDPAPTASAVLQQQQQYESKPTVQVTPIVPAKTTAAPAKSNTKPPCKFYAQGSCKFGAQCRNSHDAK